MSRLLLISTALFASFWIQAQSTADTVVISSEADSIHYAMVEGDWVSIADSADRIRFTIGKTKTYAALMSIQVETSYYHARGYSFSIDDQGYLDPKGMYSFWGGQFCHVRLIEPGVLEVTYPEPIETVRYERPPPAE